MNPYIRNIQYEKKPRGAAYLKLPMGCPWEFFNANAASHYIHIWNSWQLSEQLSGQLTISNYEKWEAEWAANGLSMVILPCKQDCPLLPYMETVGSSVGNSVGSPLLQIMKKWAVEWAANGNFAMQ